MKQMAVIAFMLLALSGGADAQSFSCPYGKQPSCLDYNDKVCSSMGKCVTNDAVCFESYTCGYDGFVCKSDMESLTKKAKSMALNYDELRNCLARATDMDEVNSCVRLDSIRM